MSTDAFRPHPTEQPQTADDEVVLRVRGPGDVLAMVRHTFGYEPRDSVVLIALHEGRTGAHLRLDLSPAVDDPAGLALTAAESLAGAAESSMPTGLVALLYVDEAPTPPLFDDPWLRPHANLAHALRTVFEEGLGIEVVQVWQVGGGHVRDYDCADALCCPYPGDSVRSAVGSLVDTHMVYRGSRVSEDPEELVESLLVPSAVLDETLLGGIRAELHRIRDDLSAQADPTIPDLAEDHDADGDEHLALWDVAADAEVDLTDPESVEGWLRENADLAPVLIGSLSRPQVRDAVLVLAAADLVTARGGLGAGAGAEELFGSTLLGSTGVRPDWARMDRLSHVLAVLSAAADDCGTSEILSMLAWIEWARGRGTVCGELVRRVETADPGHRLSGLLGVVASVGAVCPWAQVWEHSWSYHRRNLRSQGSL